jgi:putative ABC transport system permease protein
VALTSGIAFSLAPLWQTTRFAPQDALKQGMALTFGKTQRRVQQIFVSAEVALSLVLLVGAALMLRSLFALSEIDPGFATQDVVAMQVQLGSPQYSDDRRLGLYRDMVERARNLPGVDQASLVMCTPLGGGCWASVFVIQGRPSPPRDELPETNFNTVEARFFETLNIPLLRGRYFDESDGAGSPLVAIVNESFARRYWPDEDPIGQRLKHDYPEGHRPWFTVVGVVGDVKREALDRVASTEVYFPLGQHVTPVFMTLLARTNGNIAGIAPSFRKEMQSLVPDLPLGDVTALEQFRARSFESRRLPATLLALFAAAALILAVIGIFGLTSRAVIQRAREIGLRVALGADSHQVVRMVIRQSLLPVGLGTLAGLVLAICLTWTLQSVLFGVEAIDPLTLVAVSAVLAGVGLLASYWPARRAARVDPMTALRYE